MYHFYALLRKALIEHNGPGYLDIDPSDTLAVRYARNENMSQEDYANAQSLHEKQRIGISYPGGFFIPGSYTFQELPRFHEHPFVLIAKKETMSNPQAFWSPSTIYPILHDKLSSNVTIVRELSGERLDIWSSLFEETGSSS
jgi:hypothetical protein